MLLVAEKGREDEVTKIFEKWDLPCSVIGEVTMMVFLFLYE
jgi:phosphoribosylformylglycinamidine synthase